MNSRERVKKALNFEEPDRVPLDLGGTTTSGIMAQALDRLRKYLKLEKKPVKVNEVLQMLGEVEMDVVEKLGIDILPVEPLVRFLGLKRERYKPWKLSDGTDVLVPGDFEVEVDKNKKKFFFTTPYPYISGSLHLGHGRAVTESDIYTRYKRMSGENVLFSLGFHISGTPVLGISTAIKNKDPNKIKLYESYVSAYEKDKKKVKSIVKLLNFLFLE